MKVTTVIKRYLLLMAAGAMLMLAVLLGTGHAKADPYCGPGMNYDPYHGICQPGAPVPAPGLYPYPLPGDQGPGGYGLPPYGSN